MALIPLNQSLVKFFQKSIFIYKKYRHLKIGVLYFYQIKKSIDILEVTMAILAFDIGGTSVKFGLYKDHVLQETNSFPTPVTWEGMSEQLIAVRQSFSHEDIEGIAFSSPGAVDTDAGVIHGISAVSYIHEFEIVKELEGKLSLPVTIENDANCAALAELTFGAAKNSENVLFFVIGSGVGGAVAINGQLHKGRNLFGGEFGFMVMGDGRTLSESASPVHVANRFSKNAKIEPALSGKDLFELAEKGNHEAQEALDGLYSSLAKGIFNASLVVNPDLILIGGGISRREDLVNQVVRRLDELRRATHAEDMEISVKTCKFFNDANLLGAVAHFIGRKGK